jgi:hypothetical protein
MNEHVDYDALKFEETGDNKSKIHPVTDFLWWCAGADKRILRYSCYSDHVKYFGIGGVVLATGFMAFLSMSFAMHTIFGNWAVTMLIALAWALIVFNIDRFIVSSTGKGIEGSDEARIRPAEWWNAAPRLIMAVVLGFTISAPLETRIFAKEIEREWNDTKKELALKRINEEKYKFRMSGELDQDFKKLDSATVDLSKYEDMLNQKDKMIQNLVNGVEGTKCTEGENCSNGAHRSLYQQRNEAKLNVEKTKAEIETYKKRVEDREKKQSMDLEIEVKKIENDPAGFLDQLIMLEKLTYNDKTIPEYDPLTSKPDTTKEPKKVYGSAFFPVWMVRLLFVIVEILPVLLKMMLVKSPYDYMSENINQILEAKQGINPEVIRTGEGTSLQLKRNYHPEKIKSIVECQSHYEIENATYTIKKNAEVERRKIDENPESFIKPNQPEDNPNPQEGKSNPPEA